MHLPRDLRLASVQVVLLLLAKEKSPVNERMRVPEETGVAVVNCPAPDVVEFPAWSADFTL